MQFSAVAFCVVLLGIGGTELSILKNRNFSILFSGQMVSELGDNLFRIALPWYVLVLTGSKANLALTGFAQTLPGIAGLFIGVYIDRWRKKRTLIVSDVVRALLSMILFVVVMYTKSPFFIVVGLVLALEFMGTMFAPAMSAMLPKLLPKEDLPSASGLRQSGSSVAELAGSLGGGALVSLMGAPLLFLCNAISFLVSVVSLWFVRVEEPTPKTRTNSFFREWKEGFALIGKSKLILRISLAGAVANFAGNPFGIIMDAWLIGPMHLSGAGFGLIAAGFVVGMIGGGICVGMFAKRMSLQSVMLIGLTGMGVGMAMFSVMANFIWALVFALLIGYLMGLLNGSLGGVIMQVVPQHMMGRVVAPLQALMKIAAPVGMAVFGTLMTFLPFPILFGLLGICVVISGLSFLIPVSNDLEAMSETT